jgi:hypothetical protein
MRYPQPTFLTGREKNLMCTSAFCPSCFKPRLRLDQKTTKKMHFLALIHKYNYLCNIDVDRFLILQIVLITTIIVFYNSINIIPRYIFKKIYVKREADLANCFKINSYCFLTTNFQILTQLDQINLMQINNCTLHLSY